MTYVQIETRQFTIYHLPFTILFVLQTLRERLTLVLITLLPVHALLVTVGTRVLKGAQQAPWTALALWKEVLLAVILLIAGIEILQQLRKKQKRKVLLSLDVFDRLILLLFVLAVIVTEHMHGDWVLFAYGAKYDFIPLIAFIILRRCAWSKTFVASVQTWIPRIAVIISVWALIALTLPYDFFVWLGYSDMHSLFFPGKPIAAFQYISEVPIRRAQATMSGPNQYGIWLLIPLSFLLVRLLKKKQEKSWWRKALHFLYRKKNQKQSMLPTWIFLIIISLGLAASFSRTAWIGATVLTFIAVAFSLNWQRCKKLLLKAVPILLCLGIVLAIAFPDIILRISSSRGHFVRPLEGIAQMIEKPFGLGLGTAGPASARRADTCVHLRPQDDPSWAKDRTDLCVFLGSQQVQPTNRICTCPFHPENWYVQIGVELGWLGFSLYLIFIGLLAWALLKAREHPLGFPIFLAFIGIGICGLLQHAWEDGAVAYTVWGLMGVILQKRNKGNK